MLHVQSVSPNYSADSLDASNSDVRLSSRRLASLKPQQYDMGASSDSSKHAEDVNYPLTKGLSSASVQSEPPQNLKPKQGFIQTAMDDYLNSHRHSLSSVMELIGIDDRSPSDNYSSIESHAEKPLGSKDLTYLSDEEVDEVKHVGSYYYTLSPIEENSEPSTGSSTLKETMSKEVFYPSQMLSNSFDPIPSEREELEEKYQTFPRSKNAIERYAQMNEYMMYPLEPRELDPCAFNQLHTVDSQEELQEFLLLESECMSDSGKGRGLATAFTDPGDDLADSS